MKRYLENIYPDTFFITEIGGFDYDKRNEERSKCGKLN
jgi:hypothetical protein